jgi:hypothetical protein
VVGIDLKCCLDELVVRRAAKYQCVLRSVRCFLRINNFYFPICASELLALLLLSIVDNYDKQWRNHSAWVLSLEIVPDASSVPVR